MCISAAWTAHEHIFGAGKRPPELLPVATSVAQTNRPDLDLHTLRKRQSFSFGDNRLGPAMLAEQPQTETQLPKQSEAQKATSVATHEAAAVPSSGLSAASTTSAAASAAAAAADQGVEPLGQPVQMPSMTRMSGSRAQQSVPAAAAAFKAKAAQKATLLSVSSSRDPAAVASLSADSSKYKAEDSPVKGRATARTGPTSASAGSSKPGQNHTAAKPLKHAVMRKPEWQH